MSEWMATHGGNAPAPSPGRRLLDAPNGPQTTSRRPLGLMAGSWPVLNGMFQCGGQNNIGGYYCDWTTCVKVGDSTEFAQLDTQERCQEYATLVNAWGENRQEHPAAADA